MKVDVKVTGAGGVTHRCAACGALIQGEQPVFATRDGKLAAYHKEHLTNGR